MSAEDMAEGVMVAIRPKAPPNAAIGERRSPQSYAILLDLLMSYGYLIEEMKTTSGRDTLCDTAGLVR